jgi:ligand-binding SRPBCC domain-containing protein
MGKRSNFERREADFYPTPRAAVLPLVPHLRGIRTFAEPCCGDGALVRHLEFFGLRCIYAGDIASGNDALKLDDYGKVDAIITNPPYTRRAMHKLVEHFQRVAPTWLLLEMDWAVTKQAGPYLRTCSDIVAIGRLKWIPDSKHTGKDNFAWLRFDAQHTSGPVFHWRDRSEFAARANTCVGCGGVYRPQRSDARYCSNACRQRAYRARPKRNVA